MPCPAGDAGGVRRCRTGTRRVSARLGHPRRQCGQIGTDHRPGTRGWRGDRAGRERPAGHQGRTTDHEHLDPVTLHGVHAEYDQCRRVPEDRGRGRKDTAARGTRKIRRIQQHQRRFHRAYRRRGCLRGGPSKRYAIPRPPVELDPGKGRWCAGQAADPRGPAAGAACAS